MHSILFLVRYRKLHNHNLHVAPGHLVYLYSQPLMQHDSYQNYTLNFPTESTTAKLGVYK